MTVGPDRRAVLAGSVGALVCAATAAAARPPAMLRAPVRLVDAPMTDVRRNRPVRLVSDVIGARAVALSFFFTGCSSVCPMQTHLLSRTQGLLARDLGSRIALVSISIDWSGDTPRAIDRFARQHAAGPHWHFLKAPVAVTDAVRRGFDAFDPNRDDHPPVIAVGRAGARDWSRLYGFPEPGTIAAELRRWIA